MNGPGTRAGNASADEASVRRDALRSAATLIASCRTAFYPVRKTRKVRTYGILPSSRRIHFTRRIDDRVLEWAMIASYQSYSALPSCKGSWIQSGARAQAMSLTNRTSEARFWQCRSRYEGQENKRRHTLSCGGTYGDQNLPMFAQSKL